MERIPEKILFAVPCDSWRSTLESKLGERIGQLRFRHADGVKECLMQLQEFQPSVVIVELSKARVAEDCKEVFRASQRFSSTLFVAVSHEDLTQWQRLLWVCGIADSCSNISRVGKLISRIEGYLDRNGVPAPGIVQPQSIEERIAESMPW